MATSKIMFVDDDRSLLNTLERNLAAEFELCVAEGGAAALELMRTSGPFSVVIVDMRMPGMDGIQTIKAARLIAPDTVFIMLTGNQDINTAIQAVNDGQVFHFLNKPCEIAEIKEAIQHAQRQFEIASTEKVLLRETFAGSIGFMTDIIELQPTEFVNCERLTISLTQLALNLDIKIGWEERIAARLVPLGMPLLPEDERSMLRTFGIVDQEHAEALGRLCQISASLIDRIPRLERIATILREVPKVDGYMAVSQSPEVTAATLLRVSLYWCLLTQKGLPASTILQEIKLAMPRVSIGLCKALGILDDFSDECVPVEISVHQLEEGMVMFEAVTHTDGAIIVSRGRKLTNPIIEKLVRFRQGADEKVKIVAGSCPQILAQA